LAVHAALSGDCAPGRDLALAEELRHDKPAATDASR
jgi:hypothetical protein